MGLVCDTTTTENTAVRLSESPKLHGRRQIFTSEHEITRENVLDVLGKAMSVHLLNRQEIQYLYDYVRGIQPILNRTKVHNTEINSKVVVNLANQIVAFKTSEFAGEPIQYVSRSSGQKEQEEKDSIVPEMVADLNSKMLTENKPTKDIQIANYMFKGGVAYRLTIHDPNPDETLDEAPFEIYVPDPRNTFVVRVNDVSKRVVMGVTYVDTKDPERGYEYTVYTKDETFVITGASDGSGLEIDGKRSKKHNFGIVPLTEYPCNPDYMSPIEVVLPLLDAYNLTMSDRLDGVEQFIQAIMVFEGVDITREQFLELKDLGALKIPPTMNGQTGRVYYLNEQLDQTQTQTLVDSMYQTILEIVGMPSQGNGNTSDSSNNGAMIIKNGWWNAEARTLETEAMWKAAETEFLKIVLKICRQNNELNELRVSDVAPKFGRRSYEDLQVKTQSFMNLRSAGCPAIQAFKFSKLSMDPESDAQEYNDYQEARAAQLDALTNTSDPQMMGAEDPEEDGLGVSGTAGADTTSGAEGDVDDDRYGICPICGKRFLKSSNAQKYDSYVCRRKAQKASRVY